MTRDDIRNGDINETAGDGLMILFSPTLGNGDPKSGAANALRDKSSDAGVGAKNRHPLPRLLINCR